MEKYIKYGLIIINILVSLGIYIFMYYIFFYSDILENSEPIIQNIVTKENTEIGNNINVEIKGAVENPGVYSLLNTNIVNDLIIKAGGFKDNAYTKNINLSRKLTDQMVIYIYTNYEYSTLNKPEIVYVEVEKKCSCPTFDVSSCIENGSSIIEDGPSTYNDDNTEGSTCININTSSKEELMTISGIGEAKAESIIKYRETNGNFNSIEDIVNVSGISENMYAKIKDSICV